MRRALLLFLLSWPVVLGCTAPAPPPILLITISCVGSDEAESMPVLSALAAEGRRFTFAFAPSPYSLVSHASLLTGKYPSFDGVGVGGDTMLTPDDTTWAERLERAGFKTAAFVSHPALGRASGLDRGFADYVDRPMGRSAHVVVEEAMAWASATSGSRLLWVQFADPHPPNTCEHDTGDVDVAHRCELAAVDAALNDLRNALPTREWLWIICGEHSVRIEGAESIFGDSVAEDQVRVPLVVAGPRVKPADIDDPVSTVVVIGNMIRESAGLPSAGATPDDGIGYVESLNQVGAFGHNAYLIRDREPAANEGFWAHGNPVTGRAWRPQGRTFVYPLDRDRPAVPTSLPTLNAALSAFEKRAVASRSRMDPVPIEWSAERRSQLHMWGYAIR